jgi:hypothetical protein
MDSPKKSLITGINRIIFGVFVFFQGCWFLATYSDLIYSDYMVNFFFFAVIIMVLSFFIVFLGIRQCRRYRHYFKTDKKTKIMTYAELAVSVSGFSIFGIAVYLKSIFDPSNPNLSIGDINKRNILHPYQWSAFGFLLLAFLVLFIALSMYYYFLPKQIADEPNIESSNVTN